MFDNLVFTGKVRHRRFNPRPHQFAYPLMMFCFDIDDLTQAFSDIKQVSIEKFNWFSFRRKHYLTSAENSLSEQVRQRVFEKFNTYPQGKIYLLTHLACLGYCFNPISVYLIWDESGEHLAYLILEVTNTPWGERHHYVLQSPKSSGSKLYRFQFQKVLHVSPFMPMQYDYHVNLKLNQGKITMHMENRMDGKKDFDATLMLTASDKKSSSLCQVLRRYPLITYKVSAAIYWQAFRLWMKGVPFYSHPKTHKRTS